MTIQKNIFKRLRRALLAFSLIIMATTLNLAQNDKSLPTVRGKEAVESLKENGQYDSLIDAVKAAREKDGQTDETPTADAVAQTARLTASDAAASDLFGAGVAVSGETAVVGAYSDDGVFTDQGAVYIFIRNGAVWSQQQKLTASDPAVGDAFGFSVAISGDTVVASALLDDGAFLDQGSAYVFTRSGTVWTQQQKLDNPDPTAADERFGSSVAIGGDTVVVGVYLDNGAFTDQGSAYVFTRSTTVWSQQQRLTASGAAINDYFGFSVAISGETVVVGAVFSDGAFVDQGAAYVFTRSGTVWSQQQKLTALDAAVNDYLGYTVAISGDTVVVGVPNDDVIFPNQGSAYIFTRSGTVWTQQQRLTAPIASGNNQFANSVAISGETVVVGASNDAGVAGGQGSAYIFTRSGTVWTQQQKLDNPNPESNDQFGGSVAISGSNIIVGTPRDEGAFTDQGSVYMYRVLAAAWSLEAKKVAADGAPGDRFGNSVAISGETAIVGAYEDDATINNQGSVYIFIRTGNVWSEQQKIDNPEPANFDQFGFSVAISGDTVVVGADRDDGAFADQGAAYIFTRSGAVWSQQQKLTASDAAAGDFFGYSVAIGGETVIIGAIYADGAVTNQGAAYVFTRNGALWSQQQKLTASDAANLDSFGWSVAISGETVIIGAYSDDGAFFNQGAAYIFTRSSSLWTQQQKLTASDAAASDQFGNSVEISGETVVVGAYRDDGAFDAQGSAYIFTRTGTIWSLQRKIDNPEPGDADQFGWSVAISGEVVVVGANFDDGAFSSQGSAYVFERSGTVWTQRAKLTDTSGAAASDFFGSSVAITGDKIVVGALFSNTSPSMDQGAVFMFINGAPLAPTAASVSVGGRILTPEGAGLRNAVVYLTKPDGTTVSTRSTSFGYYRFENLEAGATYVIGVNSKLYTFEPQIVLAYESLSDIDFTAYE